MRSLFICRRLYQTGQITPSPRAEYAVHFTTPGTYTVWLRGYPANAAGDSVYLSLGPHGQPLGLTGFAPGQWSWAGLRLDTGAPLTLTVQSSGLYTLGLRMREDGLRIDRLLLTTDTTYIPTGFGPPETTRLTDQLTGPALITRTIVYTYDDLYRLTNATYSTGELFAYTYDPAGNRKTQTTLAGTNVYTYDTANRLTQVDGQSYTWDNNGNLLDDGSRTFTYDSADRLTSVINAGVTTQFIYNGDGDRLAQSVAGVPTNYVLDPVGLADVLVETTSGQNTYYLPGLAQYDATNGWHYVSPDRLGSVRLLVKPDGELALAQSFDPFGNRMEQTGSGQTIFGYTGEQTDPTGLVYLRARYYHPAVGRFITADRLIPDPLSSIGWNRYAYVRNNPLRYTDPSGHVWNPRCPICGKLVDVSDWPAWAKSLANVFSFIIPIRYDPTEQTLVGPTYEEWLNSALIGFATPIGAPMPGCAGVAEIKYFDLQPRPHFSINVKYGNQSLETHQVVLNEEITTIMKVRNLPEPTLTKEIYLPNAQAAQAAQQTLMRQNLGPYNIWTNSCASHVCDILSIGGIDVPEKATARLIWLKTLLQSE